jgi:uncharacterized membrane protein (UPF0136 family)
MRGPGTVILLYGLVVLGGGVIGYNTTGGMASLMAASACGIGLLASGVGVLREKNMGFIIAPSLTVLLTTFFGYRFAQSGKFIPSGLMGVLGLVALTLYFTLRR